ncbi:MAG: hypothetical protein ACREL6_03560 [Gemmatimonadales bacterium]
MTRSTWRATALLLAAFAGGGITGAAITVAARDDAKSGNRKERHNHGKERGGHLDMLARRLDLSDPQRDSVRIILDRYGPPMDSIWADVAPRFETLQERIRSDIRSQLTPEQTTRYDEMVRRLDEKRENRKRSE